MFLFSIYGTSYYSPKLILGRFLKGKRNTSGFDKNVYVVNFYLCTIFAKNKNIYVYFKHTREHRGHIKIISCFNDLIVT